MNLANLLPNQNDKNFCLSLRNKNTLCSDHEHELLFWCDTCSVVLCAECLLQHRVHDVAKLNGRQLRQKAVDMGANLADLSQATSGNIHTTKDTLKDVEKAHAKELKSIEENFKLMEDRLRLVKEETLKAFTGTTDKIQTGLKHRLFSLEGFNRDVYALKAKTEQMGAKQDEDAVLAKNLAYISKEIRHLTDNPFLVNDLDQSEVPHFSFNYDIVETLCQFVSLKNSPEVSDIFSLDQVQPLETHLKTLKTDRTDVSCASVVYKGILSCSDPSKTPFSNLTTQCTSHNGNSGNSTNLISHKKDIV